MNAARACFVLLLALPAWGTASAATVSRVEGDSIEISGAGAARVGDTVEILTRLPGFDEMAKVGSGRVTSVSSGGVMARIDQRSGALVVGQEARLSARSNEPPGPGTGSTTTGSSGMAAPGSFGGSAPAILPATPTAAPGSLERELNDALRQGQLDRVSATVGPNREVTLRGSVTSPADKRRAMDIARGLARARPIRDQVFVVEP